MSIGQSLNQRLRSAAPDAAVPGLDQRPDGSGTYSDSADNRKVEVEFADRDRYSMAVRNMRVAVSGVHGEDVPAETSAVAADVTRKLNFLEELLGVWEMDGATGTAQIRSVPPQRDGDSVEYWEVDLHVGEETTADLARYRWEPGMTEREALSYPATFPALGRIADALEGALSAQR